MSGGRVPLFAQPLYHKFSLLKFLADFPRFVQYAARIAAALQLIQPKKQLDKLAINGYNIYEISPYAKTMSFTDAFDEIYTEFRTKALLVR